MPFAGNFGAVLPGETKAFSLDFTADLGAGDAIQTLTASLEVAEGVDANAAALISGAPAIVGAQARQMIGLGPNGFQAGVVYRWKVTAVTAGSQTIIAYAHLPCAAIA
jgi:hypothetical protein